MNVQTVYAIRRALKESMQVSILRSGGNEYFQLAELADGLYVQYFQEDNADPHRLIYAQAILDGETVAMAAIGAHQLKNETWAALEAELTRQLAEKLSTLVVLEF